MLENTDNLSTLKIKNLDITKGLHRFGDDALAYINALRSYTADVRLMLGTIQEVNENSLFEYESIMHSIKGSSWVIYATPIGNKAKELEDAANDKNSLFIKTHNSAFLEDLKKLIDEIDEIVLKFTNSKPKIKADKIDSELLSSLIQACKEYNMSEVDDVMFQIEQYQYDADDELVKWLRDKVDVTKYGDIVSRFE